MAFLVKNDFVEKAITLEHLDNLISPEGDIVWQSASDTAESEVGSYLRYYYDIDIDFEKTGMDRHPFLVQMCVDFSMYYMSIRKNFNEESFTNRRNEAREALINFCKGKRDPNLTIREEVVDGDEFSGDRVITETEDFFPNSSF